jgi:membrane associated rhomboid family serine protease
MAVLPLRDRNTLKFIPFQWVTFALICANAAVFLWQLSLPSTVLDQVTYSAGIIPSVLFGVAQLPPELVLPLPGVFGTDTIGLPVQLTPVTYMFLHAGLLHLAGNMLFLWVFGDNIEDAMGHGRFLLFYLVCGIAGGLAHAVAYPQSDIPLVGASGAVSGVIAAYLLLFPRVRIWALWFMRVPLKLPAYLVLGAWLATQIYFLFSVIESNTAWWAHLGGFAAGAVLAPLLRRRDVPLLGDGRATPFGKTRLG